MRLLWRFWTDFVRRYRGWYALGIVFLVGTNLLTVAIPKFIENAIDALRLNQADASAYDFAIAIIVSGFGIIVVRTLSRTLFFNPGRTVEYDVKSKLFEHLLEQPQAFFDTARPGDLISRGTNDVNSMRTLIGFGTLQLFNVVFVLTFTLGQMLWMNVELTLLVLGPLTIGGITMGYAVKQLFGIVQELLKQLGKLSDRILESYAGVSVIQSYTAFDGAFERFDERNDELYALSLRWLKIRTFLMPIVVFLGQLCVVLILYYGGQKVLANDGTLTLGQLSAFIAYVTILVNGLRSLGFLVGATQRGYLALNRIYEILDIPPNRHPASVEMGSLAASSSTFEVKGLWFAYPGATEPTLKDIHLTIGQGQTVGIFGRTGSGKTTLMSVLSRIYDPPKDTVFMHGTDILELPVDDYWQSLAFARQTPFLFSQSIESNIAFQVIKPSDINRENLNSAIRDAALASEINSFADGANTRVGERGVTLSGGQRQRTALARLFYRPFDILLLDDVMSAVDHSTESRLIESVYRRGRDCTKLIVSHRTSVLNHADRIVVMDDGRIIDEGRHEELIEKAGPYRDAYLLQIKEHKGPN